MYRHFSFVSGDTRGRTDISRFDRNFISCRVDVRIRVFAREERRSFRRGPFNIKKKKEKGKKNHRTRAD